MNDRLIADDEFASPAGALDREFSALCLYVGWLGNRKEGSFQLKLSTFRLGRLPGTGDGDQLFDRQVIHGLRRASGGLCPPDGTHDLALE